MPQRCRLASLPRIGHRALKLSTHLIIAYSFAARTESVDNRTMLKLPKLYAITDRQMSNSTHEEIVRKMLAGRARMIQLRDKEAGSRELLDAARACLNRTRAAGAKLIINDRVDVALTADADGVHLGQFDLSVEEAREILGKDKIIGISTHSVEQLLAALATSADYIAVGPVYSTKTKENGDPVVGLELVMEAKRLTDRPIVAIGGITPDRAREVIAAGADSVAVISALYPIAGLRDLTSKPDITGSVRLFLRTLRKK
jgi:thiamine-phosphate pyrophosphorylase